MAPSHSLADIFCGLLSSCSPLASVPCFIDFFDYVSSLLAQNSQSFFTLCCHFVCIVRARCEGIEGFCTSFFSIVKGIKIFRLRFNSLSLQSSRGNTKKRLLQLPELWSIFVRKQQIWIQYFMVRVSKQVCNTTWERPNQKEDFFQ